LGIRRAPAVRRIATGLAAVAVELQHIVDLGPADIAVRASISETASGSPDVHYVTGLLTI